MKRLSIIIVAVLAITGALVATNMASAQIRPEQSTAALSGVASKSAEPGAVVQAYYHALSSKNVSLATPFLSDSVVLKVSQPYGNGTLEYAGIELVQQYLEGDMRIVNSFYLHDVAVNGERVEYTLTEWRDPRMVGPTGPFPMINRYVATVRDGKILSIVQRQVD